MSPLGSRPPNADHYVAMDVTSALIEAPERGHNRWHPDIPPLLRVAPGAVVALDLRDGLDGQITRASTVTDVTALDATRSHPMSGPIWIDGAEPGDLLEVEILSIEPDTFGSTLILPGFGLLRDRFTEPFLVRWNITDGVARSDDLPGVAIPGAPFLGVAGVAPSLANVQAITAREAALLDAGYDVLMPARANSVPAALGDTALRTLPPREFGGNLDVKHVGAGSTLVLPVDVPGALFSAGDPHFAQGDGETCGVAIEAHAQAVVRFGVRKLPKGGRRPRFPSYEFTQTNTRTRRFWASIGLPVSAAGENKWLDLNLAARGAVEEMIEYLVAEHHLTESQAYVLVSVAADLRISQIVDSPNVIVSAVLPLDVFES